MANFKISTHAQLDAAIRSAWSELESFLAGVTERGASAQDANGWTVKDHVTHMAVWEDSVAILFRGAPRHEALGVDKDFYARGSFDEINEIIRQRHGHLTLAQAMGQLREVHDALVESVSLLSDADLNTSVRDFFPLAPQADSRRMVDFIYENTAAHYTEHLPWMREVVLGPA